MSRGQMALRSAVGGWPGEVVPLRAHVLHCPAASTVKVIWGTVSVSTRRRVSRRRVSMASSWARCRASSCGVTSTANSSRPRHGAAVFAHGLQGNVEIARCGAASPSGGRQGHAVGFGHEGPARMVDLLHHLQQIGGNSAGLLGHGPALGHGCAQQRLHGRVHKTVVQLGALAGRPRRRACAAKYPEGGAHPWPGISVKRVRFHACSGPRSAS